MKSIPLLHRLTILLILTIYSVICYLSYNPVHSISISDAAEYVEGAESLFYNHSYSITLQGHTYPPRYAPWFSTLVLLPVYYLVGPSLKALSFVIYLFGSLALLLAYQIGRRISGGLGGCFAAVIILLLPTFRYFSTFIMTDVPTTALVLLTALGYLKARESLTSGKAIYLGGVISLAFGFRITNISLLFPFSSHEFRGRRLLMTTLIVILLSITLWYNNTVFGSPFRTGYHYWVSWIYDTSPGSISSEYILKNFDQIIYGTSVPALLLFLLVALAFRRNMSAEVDGKEFYLLSKFALIYGVPTLLFFLLYFYQTPRFFLPLEALLAVLLGGLAGGLFSESRAILALISLVAFLPLASRSSASRESICVNNVVTYLSKSNISPDTLIVTSNPLQFPLMGIDGLKVLPVSRKVEYASKTITGRLGDTPLQVFSTTALEEVQKLRSIVAQKNIYLESCSIAESDKAAILGAFNETEITDGLSKLSIRG